MKRLCIVIAAICLTLAASAGVKWNKAYQDYIDEYAPMAVEQMKKYGVPASITLAQGLLESGAGRSVLATKGNNHFGIKCHGWSGKTIKADDEKRGECFRAYKSARQSYEDHSLFLVNGQRYSSLFKLKTTDYKGWAHGLKRAGYATNPQYATKLIEIIELYGLDKYDRGASRHTLPTHQVHKLGKNYYVIAHEGETFKEIGKEMGVSRRSLAKYNERNKRDILAEGDIVWMKKKGTKAPREYKGYIHTIAPGESMYTIAQTYGITIKALYRINNLPTTYRPIVGDGLYVR